MSSRITQKRLESAVENLNATFGQDAAPYVEGEDGRLTAVPGIFVTDYAYGGAAVDRISTTSGGVSTVIERGTLRETYEAVFAMMRGARLMEATLRPEYFVQAAARDEGAQGAYETRNYLVRISSDNTTARRLPGALIRAIRAKGDETRNIITHHATGN
jgi:hypothetical protein